MRIAMNHPVPHINLLASVLIAAAAALPAGELDDALREANALLQRGRAGEARALLAPLAVKYPGSAGLQYTLAQAAIVERKIPLARKHLERAIRIDPKHLDARLVLSTVYRAEKKPKKALQLLQGILKENPKNGGALRGMGDLEGDARRYEAAAAWYEKALLADPGDRKALRLLATVWSRAAVEQRNGPRAKRDEYGKKAIDAYRRILRLNPDFHEIHYNLGTIALLCERYDEAAEALEHYLEKRPEDARGLFNLAQVREKQERPAEALAAWRRFLKVAGKDKKYKKDIPTARSRIQALERKGRK